VCFAGDSDCGGIDTFGGYVDPSDNLRDQCAKAGYETERSKCTPDDGMQITDYCPYDSNFVKCCSLDYQYDSCPSPLIQIGKCGNKYKCACDTSLYPYSQSGSRSCPDNARVSGASCAQVSYDTTTKQAITDLYFSDCHCDTGIYPYLEGQCDVSAEQGTVCKSRNNKGTVLETRHSTCICDTMVYPETERSCFPFTGNMLSGTCKSGDTTRYKSCNNCSGYPARTLEHVRYNTSAASDPRRCVYDSQLKTYYKYVSSSSNTVRVPTDISECDYLECPYVQERGTEKAGYFKILQCHEPGYELNGDGSACVPISCTKAVKQFVAKNKSYGLFDGSKLTDQNGNSVERSYAIVADDFTAPSSCSTTTTNISKCTKWTCRPIIFDTGLCKTVQDTTGKPICKPITIPDLVPDDPYQPVVREMAIDKVEVDKKLCYIGLDGREECEEILPILPVDPIDPVIDDDKVETIACCQEMSYKSVTLKGEGLGCSKATTYYSIPYLMNTLNKADDEVKALQVACTKNPTITVNSASFPNNTGTQKLAFKGIDIKSTTSATTFKREMEIVNGNISGRQLTFANAVTLSTETGKSNDHPVVNLNSLTINALLKSTGYSYNIAQNVQIVVPTDMKNKTMATFNFNGGETFTTSKLLMFPKNNDTQVDYNTVVAFNGSSGYTATNGYGNLYVGTDAVASRSSRSMSVKLSGNFTWNLYKDSSLYNIWLSANSKVYSADYGSGNYSKIRRNSNSGDDLAYFKMPECQRWEQEFNSHTNTEWKCDYAMICKVASDLSASITKKIATQNSKSRGWAGGCKTTWHDDKCSLSTSGCGKRHNYETYMMEAGASKL